MPRNDCRCKPQGRGDSAKSGIRERRWSGHGSYVAFYLKSVIVCVLRDLSGKVFPPRPWRPLRKAFVFPLMLQPVYDTLYAVAHVNGIEVEKKTESVIAGTEVAQKLCRVNG